MAPPPPTTPAPKRKLSSSQIAALCASAALACLPLTKSSEGEKLKPYRDPANIVTWCYGETQGPHKNQYSEAECAALLQTKLTKRYGPMVAACVPEVVDKDRVGVFAAFIDAQYNTGAVCSSPMAQQVHKGDLPAACAAFTAKYNVEGMMTPGWFTTARYRGQPHPAQVMIAHGWHWTGRNWRKVLPGLVSRRVREAKLCSTSLISTTTTPGA